jgi:adenosylhomocysteinase
MMNQYLREKELKHHAFFSEVVHKLGLKKLDVDVIGVLHVLPDVVPFHRALTSLFEVARIIPKPRSINRVALARLPQEIVTRWKREDLANISNVRHLLAKDRGTRFMFLDIGGYFASTGNELRKEFGERFIGVVEDTENGLQKYLRLPSLAYPVFQVARSPLKDNEDYMVGRAIAFSAEALLRSLCVLANGAQVGVIGYGKVGRSVAEEFRGNQGNVSVHDRAAVRLTHAYSRGFHVKSKAQLLGDSDIVCLATGNQSLLRDEFAHLKQGAFVFSVTSSDDEIDLSWLQANYRSEEVSEFVHRYENEHHSFYLFNNGNAINFVHGTTVGDFILLVHAEIMACAHELASGDHGAGIHDLSDAKRNAIAEVWLSHFATG